MPTRQLTIRRTAAAWTALNQNVYRFRLDVTAAVGMSTKVFVYQQRPKDPFIDNSPLSMFSHVASAEDLEQFPDDNPEALARPAYFRLAFIDLLLASREVAEELEQRILEDLQQLQTALNRTDSLDDLVDIVLTDGGVVEIPVTSESSSSSEAASDSSEAAPETLSGAFSFSQSVTTPGLIDWEEVGEPLSPGDGSSDASRNIPKVTLAAGETSAPLFLQGVAAFAAVDPGAAVGDATVTLYFNVQPDADVSLRLLRFVTGNAFRSANIAEADPAVPDDFGNIVLTGTQEEWQHTLTGDDLRRGEFGVTILVRNDSLITTTVEVEGEVALVVG